MRWSIFWVHKRQFIICFRIILKPHQYNLYGHVCTFGLDGNHQKLACSSHGKSGIHHSEEGLVMRRQNWSWFISKMEFAVMLCCIVCLFIGKITPYIFKVVCSSNRWRVVEQRAKTNTKHAIMLLVVKQTKTPLQAVKHSFNLRSSRKHMVFCGKVTCSLSHMDTITQEYQYTFPCLKTALNVSFKCSSTKIT